MALNFEMRGTGVNVTVVLPGPTKTPGLLEKSAVPLSKLPAPKMTPAAVARIGLSALENNKPYVIAGAMNRVMAGMGSLLGRVGARNMWGALIKGVVPPELKVR
jgi:short-subunit dehydrogenase